MSRPFPHRAGRRHRAPVVVHRPITRSLTLATRTQPHSVIPDHLRQLRVAQLALYRNSRVYHGTGGLYDSLDVVRRGQPIDSDDLQLGTTLTHHKCPSNRARKNADLRVTAVRTAKSSSNAPDVLRTLLTQDMHTAYVQNKGQTLSRQAQEEPSSDQDKRTQRVSNCEMQLREQQSKAFTKMVSASGSAPSDRTFTSEMAAHNCAQDFQQSLHSTPLLHLHGDEYMQSRTTLDFKSTACSESVAINSLKRRHTDLNECMEQASKVIKTALDGGQSEVRGLLLSTGTVKHGDRHSNIENGLKNSTPPYSSERPQVSHSASSLISMTSLNKSMPTYSPKTKVKQGLPWDEKHEEVPYDQTFYSQSSSPIPSFIPGIGHSRLQALVSDNHMLENNFLQQPQTFQDDKSVAESVSTSGDGHQSLPIGHSVRSMPSSSRSLPPSLKATSLPMHTGNGGLNKQTKFPHDLPSVSSLISPSSNSPQISHNDHNLSKSVSISQGTHQSLEAEQTAASRPSSFWPSGFPSAKKKQSPDPPCTRACNEISQSNEHKKCPHELLSVPSSQSPSPSTSPSSSSPHRNKELGGTYNGSQSIPRADNSYRKQSSDLSQDTSSPSSESALTPKLAFDYTVPGLRYIHP